MNILEIGAMAEKIALAEESESLPPELKDKIRLVSENALLGYDIESVSVHNGKLKFKAIEVKAWNREGFFQMSANEIAVLKSLGTAGWIYLVDIAKKRVVKKICAPFNDPYLTLEPTNFRIFF